MDKALEVAGRSKRPTLNPALRDFWLKPARNRVLFGGRSSSKSWDAAGMAIFLASNYKVKFLCTRQFQNRIEESVYTLLKTQIDRFGLTHEFRVLNNKIIHRGTGSQFVFYGLWRHIDEIKSLEGVDICWIEEAHNLLENQWVVLRDTVRKDDSQFWIIFNPRLSSDFVYRRFIINTPPRTVIRKINHDENPFLSETAKEGIREIMEEDMEEYNHVFGGNPREDDEAAIIKRRWIEAAIDAHEKLGIKPSGHNRVGYDPADDGPDKNAVVAAKGFHVHRVEQWKGGLDQLFDSCTRVWYIGQELKATVVYDNIGIGAQCGSNMKKLNIGKMPSKQVRYSGFNAGGKLWRPDRKYKPADVRNQDFFHNAKAQAWWLLADRFQATYKAIQTGDIPPEDELISISSEVDNLELLIEELSTPRKDYSQHGKVMVESKKDLADRGIPSPNLADAFVMAYCPGIRAPVSVKQML